MPRTTDNTKQREKRLILFAGFAVAVIAIAAALTGEPILLIALCIAAALCFLAGIYHKTAWPKKLDVFLNNIEGPFGLVAFVIFVSLIATITFFKLN